MKDPFEQPKKAAAVIDSWISKNGLLPLIQADYRFNYTVSIKHKSNRELAFCNAYAVIWEEWLLVVSNISYSPFKLEDIDEYSMINRTNDNQVPISRIIIKNNQIQTVPLDYE